MPALLRRLDRLLHRARATRWVHLVVVNLRIFIGFAFVPAGLKKVLGEPFTAPENVGVFHEFLHAFLATGAFYPFVGAAQLLSATLLMTQRFATLGAALLLPIVTAIMVFCWSTATHFTAGIVTLIFLGTVGLLLWDVHKWRGVFASDRRDAEIRIVAPAPTVDLGLWARCGGAVLALYLSVCAYSGGIYRPRGVELDTPAFWVFPVMLLLPITTFVIDRARYRRARRAGRAG